MNIPVTNIENNSSDSEVENVNNIDLDHLLKSWLENNNYINSFTDSYNYRYNYLYNYRYNYL